MKKYLILISIICFLSALGLTLIKPIYDCVNFPSEMYVTYEDIENANNSDNYSPFFKFNLPTETKASTNDVVETEMKIKLFGWLPIKKVKVNLVTDIDVYTGGQTVGFCLNSDGVVVVGSNPIFTIEGHYEPIKNSAIEKGDVIKKINGIDIKNIDTIDIALNSAKNPSIANLEIDRNGKTLNLEVHPALDLFTKRYKLGLWVQNSASGVGTLTYVKKSNGRFGAVGHPITDNSENTNLNYNSGNVYLCNYLGIKKGTKDSPGEIKTSMKLSDNIIGVADTNCEFGVYGNMNNNLTLSSSVQLGGRMSVKLGKAHILCDLDGEGVKSYEIKIVKTNHQEKANEKSIMLRVTDDELIKKTGGIIQGMSGSPIIQNDKLVGAITHVFLNDPTKAFGVYIDWMIEN